MEGRSSDSQQCELIIVSAGTVLIFKQMLSSCRVTVGGGEEVCMRFRKGTFFMPNLIDFGKCWIILVQRSLGCVANVPTVTAAHGIIYNYFDCTASQAPWTPMPSSLGSGRPTITHCFVEGKVQHSCRLRVECI